MFQQKSEYFKYLYKTCLRSFEKPSCRLRQSRATCSYTSRCFCDAGRYFSELAAYDASAGVFCGEIYLVVTEVKVGRNGNDFSRVAFEFVENCAFSVLEEGSNLV